MNFVLYIYKISSSRFSLVFHIFFSFLRCFPFVFLLSIFLFRFSAMFYFMPMTNKFFIIRKRLIIQKESVQHLFKRTAAPKKIKGNSANKKESDWHEMWIYRGKKTTSNITVISSCFCVCCDVLCALDIT